MRAGNDKHHQRVHRRTRKESPCGMAGEAVCGKVSSGGIQMARNVRATHNEHLRDPEMAAEYLSEALEEGDASVILMALRNIAEAQEDGITGLANRSHLGRESMYKMLSASGNPKLSSFTKVIHGLGLKLKVEIDKNPHRAA